MKHLTIAVVLLLSSVSIAIADQRVIFQWLAGNCSDAFRVYRYNALGWVEIAEVTEPQLEIIVPNSDVRWRVSGICRSGPNKGEWWMKQGVWTGKNVSKDVKK